MKRRDFLAAGALAGLVSSSPLSAVAASGSGATKEYYDLRLCLLDSKEQQAALLEFFGTALIPALNRLGVKPVGVFTLEDDESPNVYLLAPHATLESVATWVHRLGEDEAFLAAGADVLEAVKQEPAYARMESSLLVAFDGIPKVEIPTTAEGRIFQLRIYESHSVMAGQRKIEMFNKGGELDLFRRVGMTPVFFGEALVGTKLPNLTYMLGFDSIEAKEKAWKAFLSHPDWDKMKNDPYYKDTVSNITNIMLNPASCSQI